MVSDKQLLSDLDAVEGRTLDRPEEQLGVTMEGKDAFNDARAEGMKSSDWHPAMWNRKQRGIT